MTIKIPEGKRKIFRQSLSKYFGTLQCFGKDPIHNK